MLIWSLIFIRSFGLGPLTGALAIAFTDMGSLGKLFSEALEGVAAFDEKELEKAFLAVMEQTGLKLGKISQPVRVALTGRTASPGIFEIIAIIGKEQVLARLKRAIQYIEKHVVET